MCEKNISCRWKWSGVKVGKKTMRGWRWEWAEENPQSHGQSAVGSSVSPIWMRWRIYHSGWQDNSLICAKPTQQPHQDIAGLAKSISIRSTSTSSGSSSSSRIGHWAWPKTRPEPDQTGGQKPDSEPQRKPDNLASGRIVRRSCPGQVSLPNEFLKVRAINVLVKSSGVPHA